MPSENTDQTPPAPGRAEQSTGEPRARREPAAGGDDPVGAMARMASLRERGKEPRSASVLTSWVSTAQAEVGMSADRLSWLVASTVVVAALQRALDEVGEARFLLKGGTYLQHRLGWAGRATKDVDGLIRGDLDHFVASLDDALADPWGPLQLTRTEVEVIPVPGKAVKPRRFYVQVGLRGDVWRKIKVEVSPDEGGAGGYQETLPAPPLAHFGLPTPDALVGIALQFQIAQKIHACTDPHRPPGELNDRARDVVDLHLLRRLVNAEGAPSTAQLRSACLAVFDARAAEATAAGRAARAWPPTGVALPHWAADYVDAATKAGVSASLGDAVDELNVWINEIDAAQG